MNNLGDVGAGHVLGRYELLLPIAQGGMATVWAARLKGTRGFQKIVAVKTILPQLNEDAQFEQMFLDEASLASRIKHPHVVEISDLGEQDGVLYLVMEWVDGEPLSVLLKAAGKSGGIPLPITVRILSQACAGLHAAHELRDPAGALVGLVHRDVSPQNILVTFDGVVKVVDFGVAKAAGRISSTNAGQIKGKAAYMAPEQVRGGELDRRTDVFALGILLYFMTTGKHPFRGESDVATLYNIASDTPAVPPSTIIARYPPPLEAVVKKALAKDADKRYASANELQRALDSALPPSRRLSTDTEVAAFLRQLLSDRQQQRQKALDVALRLADERALGRVQPVAPPPSEDELLVHSGFTPPSNISRLIPPQEFKSGGRPAVAESPPSIESSGAQIGGVEQNAARETPDEAVSRRSRGRRAFGISAVLVLGGAGAFVAIQSGTPFASSPSSPPATAVDSAVASSSSASSAPDPSSSAPAAASEATDKDDAGVLVPGGRLPIRPIPPHAPPAMVPKAAAPRMPPKPTGTGFVPPVRDPGF